jgi:hypothetical protein
MPFCVRLTVALLVMLAVCAAMAQDPYAPPAGQQTPYRPPSQYPQSQYPQPQYPQPQYPQPQYQPAQYQPQYQPAPYQSPGQAGQYPPPQYAQPPQNNQPPGRYPLPQAPLSPAPPNAAQPAQPQPAQVWPAQAAAPPGQNAPVQNQTLRYPLPQPQPAVNAQNAFNTAQTQGVPQSPNTPAVQPANNIVAAAAEPAQQGELFKPGQIVARVGDKTILYADVAPTVEMRLQLILDKVKSPEQRQAMEAAYREPLTKNVIEQAVFNKQLLMEFERGIPPEMRNDPKKKSEMDGKLRKQIRKQFEAMLTACREKVDTATAEDLEALMKQDSTMVRLAVLMKDKHLDSYGELDKALKEYGTSLEQQVKDYGEYMMGMEAARTKISGEDGPKGKGKAPAVKKEVTYDDLVDYYQAHQADYYIPAKARFEVLTAKFSRCGGDRQKTWDLIAQMGNEVLLGGTPLPAVAKKYSHEPHASDGGYYDWVTPGSLASKQIDQAIFSLEVDKLSQIIEDDQGFHIVHVLERKEAGQISFQEAQPKIREKIDSQRKDELRVKYLTEVRTKDKVWTIYDPPEGAPQQKAAAPR